MARDERAKRLVAELKSRGVSTWNAHILTGGPIRFPSVSLGNEDLDGINFRNCSFEDGFFYGSSLKRSILDFGSFYDADFTSADLQEAEMYMAKFIGSNLQEADMASAYAEQANFSGANLRGADFSSAILTGAEFSGADVHNAIFGAADLRSSDLSAVRNLTQAQIEEAYGNTETKIPEDLDVPYHWVLEGGDLPPVPDKIYGDYPLDTSMRFGRLLPTGDGNDQRTHSPRIFQALPR